MSTFNDCIRFTRADLKHIAKRAQKKIKVPKARHFHSYWMRKVL